MRRWTNEECELLRTHYGKMPTKQIAELVGKSSNSVSLKAHKLGIAFNYVNKVEANPDSLRWLKRNYPHMANEICATYLGLSLRTVVRLARKYDLAIDLRPRSSVWKTGMVLSNCTGTIDEGYTNEISAVYYHVFPNMPRYKVGDRVGQIKIGCALPVAFEEVTELEERERGLNGYGSSGK